MTQPRERLQGIIRRFGGLAPVAAMLQVSMSYVSMLANGKRPAPGRAVAARIERLWGIRSVDWPS